ncbi:hypothetical protein AgCh_009662 [Apium graveolens]
MENADTEAGNNELKNGKETEKIKPTNNNNKVIVNKVQLKPIKFNSSVDVVKSDYEQKLKELHMKYKEKKPRKNRNGKVGFKENGIKNNLISVSQICDRGYHVNFYDEYCEFVSKYDGKIAMAGASVEDSWNWHKRLSHLNFKNINELVKKELVRGLPNVVFTLDGLSDSCQKSKQRKTSFKSKNESSILQPYHLVHIYLFGLVNVISIAKKRYALLIVDDYTRYTWVYFLHTKDESPSILLDHVRELEKGSTYNVKIIRNDTRTEFKNSTMEEFCKYKGIKQEFSTPRTPQQNGVIERKNRTLIEAARIMLEEAKLPTYF